MDDPEVYPLGATARKGSKNEEPREFAQSVKVIADKELRTQLREKVQEASSLRQR